MKRSKLSVVLTAGALLCATQSWLAAQTLPTIDVQPESQAVAVGTDVTLSVVASGTNILGYQWYFNGGAIIDATNASTTLLNVQTTASGDYAVIVASDAGSVTSAVATLTVTNPVVAQTFLDFNGDGKADLLWVHPSGTMAAWLMDGTNFLGSITLPLRAPRGWRMAGQADFDHDGKLDYVWQHANGSVAFWLMDGTNHLDTVTVPRQAKFAGWRVVGLDDLDDDGNTDLIWQHGNGRVSAWFMNGTALDHTATLNGGQRVQGGWKIVAVLDMDNDGEKDFLWQHGGGKVAVWYMDGTNVTHTGTFQFSGKTSSSWRIVGNTDLDGDGQADLIWQNNSGYIGFWLMNGTLTPSSGSLRPGHKVPPGWKPENHK